MLCAASRKPFLNQHTFENACRIQIDAQAGGEFTVIGPGPMETNHDVTQVVTAGQGANLAWPVLLRKLDLEKPRYDT